MVLQDMDFKNPVLAIAPRDNQKTITRISRVRVIVKELTLAVGRVRVR
jgi:hypothetical protein